MSDLDALVAAARAEKAPERIVRSTCVAVGVAAPASKIGVGAKLVLWKWFVGAIASTAIASTVVIASRAPAVHEHATMEPTLAVQSGVVDPSPIVPVDDAIPVESLPVVVASAPIATPPPELDMLAAARTAFAEGDFQAARAALDRYQTAHPHGQLEAEALVLHARIDIAQGDRSSAERTIETLEARHPDSGYAASLSGLLEQH